VGFDGGEPLARQQALAFSVSDDGIIGASQTGNVENNMLSPESEVTRQAIHTRQIRIDGFKRSDGLWDIEGCLSDVKQVDHVLASGAVRRAGEPIHHMSLRLTVDEKFTIVAAQAMTHAMPYAGICNSIAPDYQKLRGMHIGAGFGKQVAVRFGGTNGCTHLTELLGRMVSGAIQTMTGRVARDPEVKPFQLDGCHALATNGPVVAQFYPRWYVKAR
jgi:hypothetical protein